MRPPFNTLAVGTGVVRILGISSIALLIAPSSYAQVRTVELTEQVSGKPVALSCTAGLTTRIVFPEPSRRLKVSAGAKEKLGVRFVATNPHAIVEASPKFAGAIGTIEFTGASGTLTILVTAVESEAAQEIRLVRPQVSSTPRPPPPTPPAAASEKRPTREPPPSPTPARIPTLTPSAVVPPPDLSPKLSPAPAEPEAQHQASPRQPPVETAALPPTPPPTARVPTLDVSELLQLRPVVIGRREGLPGQRPLILEDALKSDANVWLRFRLVGGSKERVGQISWEHGPLSSFLQTADGKDLRLIVKLPRSDVTKKTRVRIRLDGEKADRSFSLDSPWLSSFLRSLVQ